MVNIRQFVWDRLRGPFVSMNGRVEYPETFYEELNDQCRVIIIFAALIATFAWLPYIVIDRQLYPGEPLIIALRIGFSLMGFAVLVLQGLKRFHRYHLLLLVIMSAYLEIATGVITGLTRADSAYMGGYLLVLTLLALVPIPRREAWTILTVSLTFFFAAGFIKGMHFESLRLRYSLNDLLVTCLTVAFFIYLLDRLRFNSWEKSRRINQQNKILTSDKVKIDELLQGIQVSEAKYRQLFDRSPVGIILTTAEGKVLAANRVVLDLLKFESIDAMNAFGLQSLYVNPQDRIALWEIAKNGPVSGYETVFRKADGDLVAVAIGGYLVYDESGNASLLEGTIEDITERKHVEEALRESEDRLRTIIESTQALLVSVGIDGKLTYVNDATAKALGYKTPAEIIGRPYLHFVQTEDRPQLMKNMIHQIDTRLPSSVQEFRIVDTEGRVKWISFVSTLLIKNGTCIGQTGVGQDVTNRKQMQEELRASEERLRNITYSAQDAILMMDSHGDVSYWNPAAEQILGYRADEILGKNLHDLLAPERYQDAHRAAFPEFQRTGRGNAVGTTLDLFARRKDGREIPISLSMSSVLQYGAWHAIGIIRDISERMRAEQALRQNDEKYRLLTENSNDVIWTIDTDLHFTYYSPAVRKLRGLEPEEAKKLRLEETMTPSSLEAIVDTFRRNLPDVERGLNPTAVMDVEEYRKDGSTVWAEISVTTMRDDHGNLTGYIGVTRDISARKAAEEALRESEHRLADIINFLPIATMVIDHKGRVTAWNQAMEAITGVNRADIIGKGDYEYGIPFYGEKRPILIDLVFAPVEDLETRYSHIRREGGILSAEAFIPQLGIILLGYASALYGSDGSVIGAIESIWDVTDIRRVEAELKEAKNAAVAANQSKSAFLANMSHEIRTPMNAILGFAQLMQQDPDLTPQLREHLNIINRSGEHLLTLINDILEMSKIEAGRATFIPNTFNFHSFLDDLESMFRIRTETKKLWFLLEKIGDIPRWIITDEGKLLQILINLLGNAVKFTEEGGIALRICAKSEKSDVINLQFEVDDTGPGMTGEEMGRLFQAFEQTNAGIRSGGTGLGLALSRGFIQIMGGFISVTSAVGKGSVFRFEIPVKEGTESQTQPKKIKKTIVRVKPEHGEMRVLIADDRETNRLLLSKMLSAVGFQTKEVINGAEAIRAVHVWKPQVIIMDMSMPVMDGYEATRIIKASPETKNITIIAVTASAFEEDKQRVLAAGVDGYLAKPFKTLELLELIGTLTGVAYLYEEATGAVSTSTILEDRITMSESIASLPVNLVDQIHNAVESADIDRLNEIIGQLTAEHAMLAQRMREMAERYEYEALMDLFSPGV